MTTPEISSITNAITDRLVANTLRLPTLPDVLARINALLTDDTKGVSDMSEVILTHPALSARLMQVVNSPALRPVRPVVSMAEAVTVLGVALIRNLAISIAIRDLFRSKNESLANILRATWAHSAAIASYSFAYAKTNIDRRVDASTAMTIGVLHSVGSLPIIAFFEDTDANPEALPGVLAQLSPLLTAHLFDQWGFPGSFKQAVQTSGCLYGSVLDYAHRYVEYCDARASGKQMVDDATLSFEKFDEYVKQYDMNEVLSL